MTQTSKNQGIATKNSTATTATTEESKLNLCNPNKKLTTKETDRTKYLLYLVGGKTPLLGFVYATTKAAALDRVRAFKLPVIAVEADAPESAEPMTPEKIARHFELFRSIIPAATDDPARRRTSYFYRKQAIEWAKMARHWWPGSAMQPICRRLAKRYLALYRFAKAMVA